MPIDVIVCETCRQPGPGAAADLGADPQPGWTGAMFAALLEGVLASTGAENVRVGTMRCLMSCRRPCVVHIRSSGRMGYVLGDLPPERSAVEALVGYLLAYGATDDGIVAYRDWPDGVKGRFVARVPAPSDQ
ncbi:DUF1636 domain-containing protein [Azospirillum melinis]|uniref:DUF1636 domain-containing protein n=1 Tax=Azospirillum melinis TaxID=328839 RepID=A0ABX2KJX7_9PROT|nr:DUF1636 domain-containing protein [Azospirillum melinis]MBP2310222.1 putative metal-binding protein [Azospirillum melinis]NUB02078.1 DUF1636 domain-containing protein [Azospirillum melinis]